MVHNTLCHDIHAKREEIKKIINFIKNPSTLPTPPSYKKSFQIVMSYNQLPYTLYLVEMNEYFLVVIELLPVS
jgi:hypothetical protein